MKHTAFLFCFVLISIALNAQLKWPEITQAAKPWTRWWWQGSAVNEKDLRLNMEQYKAAGLGGLEITPIYGVQGKEKEFIPYLSPRWIQVFSYTLKEAKRLGLGIDMATGTGWPFGGGADITDAEACRNIVYKIYNVSEGQSLNDKINFIQEPLLRRVENPDFPAFKIDQVKDPVTANSNLQELALDQVKFTKQLPVELIIAYSDGGQWLDLTSKLNSNGQLDWKAPAGNWKVYALFTGWHGKMVERAAPGGEGNVIDHFSDKALAKYLSRFDKAFAGVNLSHLRSYFNDSYEVDDARGQSNWTPGFVAEFVKRRGYDLKEQLTSLFNNNPSEKDLRVLYDYRATISELLLENFTRPWHQWAGKQGKLVRNQSHGSPANILDLYAAIDIPETEGNEILRYKFASSAANVTGKKLVSAEAATWLNEHFKSNLGDVKQAVDKFFLGGVNHIFYHGTSYSPAAEPWPGWLFYAAVHFTQVNPFWRDFAKLNDYVARAQSFLQHSKADNDILLYFPFTDYNMEKGRDMLHHYDGMNGFENTVFKAAAEEMVKKGFSFDLVSDKQLLNTKVENHQLLTDGGAYKTILVAGVKYLELEVFQKLVEAAKQGAKIIFYDRMPESVPGFKDFNNRQNKFDELVASLELDVDDSSRFTDALSTSLFDKGVIFSGTNLTGLLGMAGAARENMVYKGLSFLRKKNTTGTLYFIKNDSDSTFSGWADLSSTEDVAAIYNLLDGRAGKAFVRKNENGMQQVYLQLSAGETVMLQLQSADLNAALYQYYEAEGNSVKVSSSWKFSVDGKDQQLTFRTVLTELQSWTKFENGRLKYFSGTGIYESEFSKPTGAADAYALDLGDVQQSAEIWLNGKLLTTLIGPQFKVIIPASLLQPTNKLRILVANGMANRIIGLEKQGVKWKKFYNVNFPSWKKENRDEKGIFTAAGWEPESSGLLGPVSITPLKLIKTIKSKE